MRNLIALLSFILPVVVHAVGDCSGKLDGSQNIYDINAILRGATRPAIATLLDNFRKTQLFMWATPSHDNLVKMYDLLSDFLLEAAKDPNLKYVILERPNDEDAFYQALSVQPLGQLRKMFRFASADSATGTFMSPEWVYTIQLLMPVIQKINQTERNTDNPLLVRTVDGVSIGPAGLPTSAPMNFFYAVTGSRENDTARNFNLRIWSQLKPTDKVIVVYHLGHLIKGIYGHATEQVNGRQTQVYGPTTWFARFLAQHPEAKAKARIIAYDDETPRTTLNFTAKAASANPLRDQPFGITFADLPPEFPLDRGRSICGPSCPLFSVPAKDATSNLSLRDMIDGIVHMPGLRVDYSQLPSPAELKDLIKDLSP